MRRRRMESKVGMLPDADPEGPSASYCCVMFPALVHVPAPARRTNPKGLTAGRRRYTALG